MFAIIGLIFFIIICVPLLIYFGLVLWAPILRYLKYHKNIFKKIIIWLVVFWAIAVAYLNIMDYLGK